MLMLALPGCTYLYMGEELGLPEVLDLPDARREDPLFSRTDGELLGRDGCRVPMPWTVSAARSFGFSARETSSWLPQPSDWGGYSVEAQENDPGSMLAFYRAALALRPTFVRQGDRIECRRDGDVLVISRGTMTVAVNFGDRPAPLDSTLASSSVLLASGELVDGAIAGNSALWVRRD
jgi:alpha-glucosidase